MKKIQDKVLKALQISDCTSQELINRTGLSMGQIKNAINKLRTAGKVDISKTKHKKTIWTLGESEEKRREREQEESRIFASEHFREITKKAFLKRSYR